MDTENSFKLLNDSDTNWWTDNVIIWWKRSGGSRISPMLGARTLQWGANIRLCQIFKNMHEIVRIWNRGDGSKILLCRFATGKASFENIHNFTLSLPGKGPCWVSFWFHFEKPQCTKMSTRSLFWSIGMSWDENRISFFFFVFLHR